MEALEREGLINRRERRNVLSNVLAIVVPANAKTTIQAPADLKKLHTIALADPAVVPAGVYARRYLQSIGVWDDVRDKVVPTLDVRAALTAVETERAEAGIVYATDAAVSKKVREAFRVPREQGPPIVYTLAPLVGSKRKKKARGLVHFLASSEAATIYTRYGFIFLPAE
jgi:molybdate transport system substrate-binding protein